MIRVILPYHLRTLAQTGAEVQLEVGSPVTQRSILDALETRYPMLRGTIRDHVTGQRRAMLRFFACKEDLSLEPPDVLLPDAVAQGKTREWMKEQGITKFHAGEGIAHVVFPEKGYAFPGALVFGKG